MSRGIKIIAKLLLLFCVSSTYATKKAKFPTKPTARQSKCKLSSALYMADLYGCIIATSIPLTMITTVATEKMNTLSVHMIDDKMIILAI